MDARALVDVRSTYGALYIGLLFAIIFHGILCVQVYHYYDSFQDDPPRLKMFVVVLWFLDFVHLVLISYSVYFYLVLNWGNPAILPYMPPAFNSHLLLVALITLLSQSFFLRRIWIISKENKIVTGTLLTFCLLSFGLVLYIAYIGYQYPGPEKFKYKIFGSRVTVLFTAVAITDIEIAACLCYYLIKRSAGTERMVSTQYLVTQVIRHTVATSTLTCLIALAAMTAQLVAPPPSFVFIGIHFSTGRAYANAVLTNLNARRKFREALCESTTYKDSQPLEFAVTSSRAVCRTFLTTRQSHVPSQAQTPISADLSLQTLGNTITIPSPMSPAKLSQPRTRYSFP